MSRCPACHEPARHLFRKVRFDDEPDTVVHLCENDDCHIIDFSEKVRS